MSYNIKFDISPNGSKIIFGSLEYNVDLEQSCKIAAFTCENNIKWKLNTDISEHIYYINSYAKKYDIITIIDVLYGKNKQIVFKNNNTYDLRKDNIVVNEIQHKYDINIRNKFNIIEFIQGHYRYEKYYNPTWKTSDNIYLVFCEPSVLIEFNEENYNKFKNVNFYDFIPTWNFVFKNSGTCYDIITKYKKFTYSLRKYIDNYNIYSLIRNDENQIIIDLLEKQNCNIFYDYYNISTSINIKNTSDIKKLDKIVQKKYNVICAYTGHRNTIGIDAHIEKNRRWKFFDKNTQQYLYLMYCEKDTLVLLDKKAIKEIKKYEEKYNNGKKITWYKMKIGYIGGTFNKTKIYMHQVIMHHFGHGQGTSDISVDHIDGKPLNNMYSNLRLATREEQEQNTRGIMDDTKRNRKENARPLPAGITQDMMPKYVVYYKEYYNKEKTKQREFFKVEKHPNQIKPWATKKRANISIQDKLIQAKNKLAELNAISNDI
jgi:hypothetical protein